MTKTRGLRMLRVAGQALLPFAIYHHTSVNMLKKKENKRKESLTDLTIWHLQHWGNTRWVSALELGAAAPPPSCVKCLGVTVQAGVLVWEGYKIDDI